MDALRGSWIRGFFAGIGARPFVLNDHFGGMRCVFQHVLIGGINTVFHFLNFVPDADQCIAETVQLGLGFRFCGFDHDRSSHRKTHGGRVIAIIHQAFCHVFFCNARRFFDRTNIQNKFVGIASVFAPIQNGVMRSETFGHVIGIQNGVARGIGQSFTTHHGNVRPRDEQHTGRAIGRC